MKTTILITILTVITFSSFSQTMHPDVGIQEYYLKKSRHQRTIGWIMLGSGIALTSLGFGVATVEAINSLGETSGNTGSVLAIVGVASALGSIPLFISAGRNKRKAADLAFSIQKIPMLCIAKNPMIFQPALTVKVSL